MSERSTVDFDAFRAESAAAPFLYRNVDLGVGDVERYDRPMHGVVDVWAFDPDLTQVLLIRHPHRGWVMPGGRTEPGEDFRAAAVRELSEETGIVVDAGELTAAAVYLGFDPGVEDLRVGIAFACRVDPAVPLRPEPGLEVAWWSLQDRWDSVYPHDRDRLLAWRDHAGPGTHP